MNLGKKEILKNVKERRSYHANIGPLNDLLLELKRIIREQRGSLPTNLKYIVCVYCGA